MHLALFSFIVPSPSFNLTDNASTGTEADPNSTSSLPVPPESVYASGGVARVNLPAPNSSVPELPQGLNLEVIVRKTGIDIADRGTGVLRSLPLKVGSAVQGLVPELAARVQRALGANEIAASVVAGQRDRAD